jgi:hypothetical protein
MLVVILLMTRHGCVGASAWITEMVKADLMVSRYPSSVLYGAVSLSVWVVCIITSALSACKVMRL